MPLGPEDVVRKTFKTSLFKRGYDETEVDAFLEEVAADLRRREQQREELLIRAQRPRSVEEVEAERVAREREQLDLIKTERQELVSELGGLQSRLVGAREEVVEAERRAREAAAAQEEAEARRDEARGALTQLHEQVARAQAIHDDLRAAHDALMGDLRGLRVESETRAFNVMGRQPVEPAGTPQDDIEVIAEIARSLHEQHVAAGEARKKQLLEEAESASHDLLQRAKSEASRAVEDARRQQEQLLQQARTEADNLVAEANALKDESSQSAQRLLSTAEQQSREISESARAEHARLIAEAEEERAGILADLQARRELLERRIVELDQQQDGYRERLRALVQQQLASLNDDGWRAGLNGSVRPEVDAER